MNNPINDLTWRADAEAHARSVAPLECCGLVLRLLAGERYVPCRNHATTPGRFELDTHDWADAEDSGEIVAVVHSHVDESAEPSAWDIQGCNASGLPWHIIGLPDGVWVVTEPTTERVPLVGRSYAFGAYDCYSLIRDYYAWELGIELPDFPRGDKAANQGAGMYVQGFASAGFREIAPSDARANDVVLVQIGRAGPANHGGVLLDGGLILHHALNRLSAREVFGGYWRKHAVLWLRHRSLDHA